MADNQENNLYKEALISKFPFSTYARQLKRGVINVDANTESNAHKDYEVLYTTFMNGDYIEALKKAEKGLYDYTGTSLEDKFAMLRILILAKNGDENIYRIALMDFMKSYPSSSLTSRVNNMLATLTKKP
jgi:outer membrane protein assembly factor BamD (BamD/ComL family)